MQSIFEIVPALAPAAILFDSMIGLSSATGKSLKTKANFSFNKGKISLSYGIGLPPISLAQSYSSPAGSSDILSSIAFLMTEFFPIKR